MEKKHVRRIVSVAGLAAVSAVTLAGLAGCAPGSTAPTTVSDKDSVVLRLGVPIVGSSVNSCKSMFNTEGSSKLAPAGLTLDGPSYTPQTTDPVTAAILKYGQLCSWGNGKLVLGYYPLTKQDADALTTAATSAGYKQDDSIANGFYLDPKGTNGHTGFLYRDNRIYYTTDVSWISYVTVLPQLATSTAAPVPPAS